jgi:phospholipid/cholesterol/gamma-HCH transport system ATP-binding protein
MIEAREVHKSFGAHRVLDGVTLQIQRGESVVIIGPSGGGKSVLLKVLIGLLPSDAGDIFIDGQNITHMTERQLLPVRRKFGMLFQGAALFDSMTVAENVSFALRRDGKGSQEEIQRKVGEALEMVELTGTEEKKPAELSGGMRKRVGLARAIIYQPQILLYDEPTTGLDPVAADRINRLIVRISQRLQATQVAVTHDMRSAARIAQRILMLHEGHIHATGTPEEILHSKDPVVRQFVEGKAEE